MNDFWGLVSELFNITNQPIKKKKVSWKSNLCVVVMLAMMIYLVMNKHWFNHPKAVPYTILTAIISVVLSAVSFFILYRTKIITTISRLEFTLLLLTLALFYFVVTFQIIH